LSGTAENEPDSLSQLTPLSSFKVPGSSKNKDTLTQLTPTSLISPADLVSDVSPQNTKPAMMIVNESSGNVPATDELIPAKHSSSKRVKLIKQEKK